MSRFTDLRHDVQELVGELSKAKDKAMTTQNEVDGQAHSMRQVLIALKGVGHIQGRGWIEETEQRDIAIAYLEALNDNMQQRIGTARGEYAAYNKAWEKVVEIAKRYERGE